MFFRDSGTVHTLSNHVCVLKISYIDLYPSYTDLHLASTYMYIQNVLHRLTSTYIFIQNVLRRQLMRRRCKMF